jgi:hypothetical protein
MKKPLSDSLLAENKIRTATWELKPSARKGRWFFVLGQKTTVSRKRKGKDFPCSDRKSTIVTQQSSTPPIGK